MVVMRDFFKKFEDAMASAAFAEAGEFDSARQMISSNKKVLLGTESTNEDHKAFRYAFNLCRRVDAKLEILHILRPSDEYRSRGLEELLSEVKDGLKPVFDRLVAEGVDFRLNFGEGKLEEEVVKYADGRNDILLVVIEPPSGASRKKSSFEKRMQVAIDRLKCPLVVVSESA
jgi:nucleotide-binding universal stress UspA family protein